MNDLMALTVVNTSIRRDALGRYCLNDLHQAAVAAGYNQRATEPGQFFRSKRVQMVFDRLWEPFGGRPETTANCRSLGVVGEAQTNANCVSLAIVGDAETTPRRGSLAVAGDAETNSIWGSLGPVPIITIEGRAGGTWVVERLLYHYASWVDPLFLDKVVNALDHAIAGRLASAAAQDRFSDQHANQAQRYWFARYPRWARINAGARVGEPYASIARALGCKPASVARAVRSQIRIGLLHPRVVAVAQCGPARRAAQRLIPGWGQQLALDL